MADISMNFFSKMMGRFVSIEVLLPIEGIELYGYKEPFKTLYFLPGYSASARSIATSTTLAEHAAARGFAVVIPDGENSFYTDQEDIGALYERYVSEELVAFTRRLFPLSKKREDTFIGGISMGGFGCLMLGSRHMETFSKILAMSPATDCYRLASMQGGFNSAKLNRYFKSKEYYFDHYHPFNNFQRANEEGKVLPEIFLCCGEQDPLTYEMDRDFVGEMKKAGMPVAAQWGEGTHDTKYWNAHLPAAVDFMLNT